ncbi:Putative glycoside hydrolase superfamily [Septoria linicola]|uniref:Glycoside hydrolase superfamily n=1 Tax=Septoria linicola TaxID=215465 RepID=A0A9Q9ARU3_9PEZI|nr:putative glycoside hydrolase superfamily [Septoria linicola]USW50871.1 Putative glycoside hydrolase superfamily [Septoria linicola]
MASIALALLATQAFGSSLVPRQNSGNTAVVDLSVKRGTPQHLASGFIYGIPDTNQNQIPDIFYQDIGFNYGRFGGAQLDAGGWIYGKSAYNARLQSTYNNYVTSRKYGAKVVLLPHDIWGTDHANSSTVWPGDNGDWTDYDNFLNTLISDLKRLNMLNGLVWDLWNEPDLGTAFWGRSQAQYLDMTALSMAFLSAVLHLPASLQSITAGGQIGCRESSETTLFQDQYAWHDEPGDPANDYNNLGPLLQKYGAPSRPGNINEYATFDQQTSVGAAWWISRLERYTFIGLRGNWLSKCQLRDFMASLLAKTDTNSCTGTGYYGNGEFQVYKYYNRNMTGVRAGTTGSGDGVMDVYTTIGSTAVKTLTGCTNTGTYYVTINKLSAVGLPTSGSLAIQTYGFVDQGHFGRVDGPTNRGVFSHTYSGDSVTFPVYQTSQDQKTAWGFEFKIGGA